MDSVSSTKTGDSTPRCIECGEHVPHDASRQRHHAHEHCILVCVCTHSVYSCLLLSTECVKSRKTQCLTGYMTEVQSWVDEKGVLTVSDEFNSSIDLSANSNPVAVLQQKVAFVRDTGSAKIRYLSLARCRLTTVPTVFSFRDAKGQTLSETLEYITFYGNEFSDISPPGQVYGVSMNATNPREHDINTPFQRQASAIWSKGFAETNFPKLKELDLRACFIQIINDNVFKSMPTLEALYIGENQVYHIDADAFVGLKNLKHLDFSDNAAVDDKGNPQNLIVENLHVFKSLENLLSLDMSYTPLTQRHVSMLRSVSPKLTRLSLCESGLTNLEDGIFNRTALRLLDLSGNYGIFGNGNILRGLEDTLKVLYAKDTGLRTMDIFEGFGKLEILDVSVNEISTVRPEVTKTLKSLKVLDLYMNRVATWLSPTFSLIPKLKLLSLRENNINLISEDIIKDVARVQYIGMSGNFIVCNCHTRDFFDLALNNERHHKAQNLTGMYNATDKKSFYRYHRGYIDYNELIMHRNEVTLNCSEEKCSEFNENVEARFLLLDYHPGSYMCLLAAETKPMEFSQIDSCNRNSRDIDYDKVIQENEKRLYILFSIPVFLLILIMLFVFRRNFRYFMITIRNSAMLSVVHKHEFVDEGTIFHYDVFVSYCNEDRNWVLDHLLPHLESDCSISACLHERDFQVGHSILENIVSCMDRSRSIMLIISPRFLLSQWCQFEMHLAQHRLLETRREDLTLVLLEEIPRRMRPNTLHYLMLTKTYIVWPGNDTERALFWRRIRKTLVTMKLRQPAAGASLA